MKNTSKLLLIFGSVISIICAVCMFLSMVTFIVLSTPPVMELIKQGIEEGTINSDIPVEATEGMAIGLAALFIIYAVAFAFLTIIFALAAVFGFSAKRRHSKGGYVTAIVFGALTDNPLLIAGGIVGVICKSKEKRNEEVIDVTK